MTVLLDTGPLVAALNDRDAHHAWAQERMNALQPPALTCEAVLTEAHYLLRRGGGDPVRPADLVARGALRLVPVLSDAPQRVAALMRKYADVPMALADACLVVLAEAYAGDRPEARVFTLDTDFGVYRMHGRRRIPLLAPFA